MYSQINMCLEHSSEKLPCPVCKELFTLRAWPEKATDKSTEEQNNLLYNKAIRTFGINAQTRVFIEECAEAIVEVTHYFNRGKSTLDDVASELADVEIMLAQMKIIVNNEANEDLVGNYKHVKLNRLAKKLEEER